MRADEELAYGVQRGSKEDLTVLVERYYQPLLIYLYRMCGGNQALAEDMVQETLLRVMRGISLYQRERPFKTWLYTIATNIVRNHFQRADTRYTDNTYEEMDYVDDRQQPEETITTIEEAQLVLQVMTKLPEHQREVVVLFYYQELSQQQIADILHIPVGTVKSRLSIGLRRLRDMINEMENSQ